MIPVPYDDIVEISQRCDQLRRALLTADDAVKTIPCLKYAYLCEASGERPNLGFLRFSEGKSGGCADFHRAYLSQRAILPVLLTLPLCPWLEHINLRENRLTTTLVQLLCQALRDLPRVKIIDVSENPFGSFGMQAILNLVLRKSTVVDCRVDGIQCVGSLLRRLHNACELNKQKAVALSQRSMPAENDESNSLLVTVSSFIRLCGTRKTSTMECTTEKLQQSAAEFFERGDFLNAIKQWEAVIASQDATDDKSLVLMSSLNNLACAYGEIGNYAKKLQLLERSRKMVGQTYGTDHPQYGMILYNIACVYEDLGRYGEMEELLLQSLTIHEKKFNTKHAKVGRVLLLLAEAHCHLGKYEEQLHVANRAFEIVRRHCGPEHTQTTIAMLTLSRAYGSNNNHVMRLRLAQQAFDIQERKLGPMNPQIALTLIDLADAHGANGDYLQKKELLEKAIEIQKRAFGSQHRHLFTTYTTLGDACGEVGDVNGQVDCYCKALEIARQRYRGKHIAIGSAASKCARGYLRIGKVKEAAMLVEEARGIVEGTVSEMHPAAVGLRATIEELKKSVDGDSGN